MRYVMKQKFWSWGDDFTIRDEQGHDVFLVDGRAFSWGDKLSFQDMSGNEVAFIRQKLLSWGPTYEIEVHGQMVAVVKKLLGDAVAKMIGPVWGLGADGEMNNMWKRTAQEGLWFVGGSFSNCRIFSRFVALQIKAIEEGLMQKTIHPNASAALT